MICELIRTVKEEIDGVTFEYREVYFLDYYVDENTGRVDENMMAEYYSKTQMGKNREAMLKAYGKAKEEQL